MSTRQVHLTVKKYKMLNTDSLWVKQTLKSLTLNQKVGQLLHPNMSPNLSQKEILNSIGDIEPGGVYLFSGCKRDFKKTTTFLQDHFLIPIIISADLENGAGRIVKDATIFPDMMGLAATGSEAYAMEMGRAAALEGKECGISWCLGPVVDINANPFNPIVNTRGMGDDPDLIIRLSRSVIVALQSSGMCATAKHFPGDGFDDRDQHICTTINPLSMQGWFNTSGRIFKEAIDVGVWSIMVGHISLPAWDSGDACDIETAPPATQSYKLITGLLREKLGFQGVIITDAMGMGGVTSRGMPEEICVRAIEAGCDMILFSVLKRDFYAIKKAVQDGRITEERIDQSVRRILALKESCGLIQNPKPNFLEGSRKKTFQKISVRMAVDALTLVKDQDKILPLNLKRGAMILSYHIRGDASYNVDHVDEILREYGFEVKRIDEADLGNRDNCEDTKGYELILVNMVFGPNWGTGRIRPTGGYMRTICAMLGRRHPHTVFVSYGSPYLLHDLPQIPTLINAYSIDQNTQRAVVRLLTGEIKAKGKSPVRLSTPYNFNYALGQQFVSCITNKNRSVFSLRLQALSGKGK